MSALSRTFGSLGSAIKRQVSGESLSAVFHVLALLAFVTVIRPLFSKPIGGQHYEAYSIVMSVLQSDLDLFVRAANRNQAVAPEVMFLFVPAMYFVFTKRRLRWTDWTHGHSLRILVMGVLAVITWAATTFEFNYYLHRGHGVDRLLLVTLFGFSWRYPLLVPFVVRLGIILLREGYTPINLDDFEFRTVTELATIFSVFVWASAKRSFQPWHVVVVGIGSWASYYFVAGLAKLNYGPAYSWLLEDRLTNFTLSTHMHGWLTFVSDETLNAIIARVRPYDNALNFFTVIVELGALAAFFVHRRVARTWFFLCFLLNFGIFMMTGVCFYKWMLVNLLFIFWLRRDNRLVEKFYRHKFALLVGVLSVYYSANRIWYFPQTHVVWYDTQLLEQYEIVVVGKSGAKYIVDPNYFAPQDMHFVQGALCYATENERAVTHIYGSTGSYDVMKALNTYTDPAQALALHRRGPVCSNAQQRGVFDNYMKRFFDNINRFGRPYEWLTRFGAPHHLWIDVRTNEYKEFDEQEIVTRLELWRSTMYAHGGKYHMLEKKLAHRLDLSAAK